jgi:hypothetical protein
LAAELKAVQAKLDIVTTHKQKLIQENQELRQEITKVIKAFTYLEKLVDSTVLPGSHLNPPSTPTTNPPQSLDREAFPRPQHSDGHHSTTRETPLPKKPARDSRYPTSEPKILIKEAEVRYHPISDSEGEGLNNWWLVVTIILIMVMGFSAGYFFVRPLFQQQSR